MATHPYQQSFDSLYQSGNYDRRLKMLKWGLDYHTEYSKRRTTRFIAMGTWALVIAICLMQMCCASSPMVKRSISQENDATVQISGHCSYSFPGTSGSIAVDMEIGSAVVTDASHVLTALHVVDNQSCSYKVRYWSGLEVWLRVEKTWPALDVARLVPWPGQVLQVPAPLGKRFTLHPGERVCLLSALPTRKRRCGETLYFEGLPPGNIAHTAITEPGNSGGGVYSEAGELVGITTHYTTCFNGQLCGGRFTSLTKEMFQ